MFEPFQVTCLSCQGKIMVKNERLVGRMAACPRCQTSLLIQSPQKLKISPPIGSADSHAITKVADPDWEQALSDALATRDTLEGDLSNPASLDNSLLDNVRFRQEEDEFRLAPVAETLSSHFARSELESLTTEPISRPVPTQNWSQSRRTSRQWLIILALGLGGCSLAIVGFIAFVRWNGKPSIKGGQASEVTSPNEPTSTPPASENKPAENTSDNNTPTDDNSALNSGTSLSQPSENQPDEKTTTPDSETPAVDKPLSETPSSSTPSQSIPNATEPKTPQPNGNADLPSTEPPKTAEGSPPSRDIELPKIFRDFGANRITNQTDNDPTLESPQVEEPVVIEVEEIFHPPSAKSMDSARSLAQPISTIAWNDTPLIDIVHGFSLITGLGISIDYESFIASGLSPLQPVTFQSESKTAGEVLQALLESLQLEKQINDQGLITLFAPDALIAEHLPIDWNVDDLAQNQHDAWKTLLNTLMSHEPLLWKWEGSDIVWQPTATPKQKARLALLLDRIRVSLKKPPKGKYLQQDLQPGWDDLVAASQKLENRAQSINPYARPILQLMANAARELDLRLLVDWPSMWDHGLTPTQSQLSLLRNRRFGEIVRSYQERHALEFTVLNDSLVMLTIPEIRRLHFQFRVVPLRPSVSVETMREKLLLVSPTDDQRRSTLVVAPIPDQPWAVIRITPPTMSELGELLEFIR